VSACTKSVELQQTTFLYYYSTTSLGIKFNSGTSLYQELMQTYLFLPQRMGFEWKSLYKCTTH